MSCISSNFSSFFLNSLNDPSEFAKYLSNGELKVSPFEDFQVFGTQTTQQQQQQQQQQQYLQQQQQQQQHQHQQSQLPLNGTHAYYPNNNSVSSSVNASSGSGSSGSSHHAISSSSNAGVSSAGGANAAGVPNGGMEPFNGGAHIEAVNYTSQQHPLPAAASAAHQQQTQMSQQSHLPQHSSHQPHPHPHPHTLSHPPQTHTQPQHYGHATSSSLPPSSAAVAFHHNQNLPSSTSQNFAGTSQVQRWPTATSGTLPHASAMHTVNNHPTPMTSANAQHFDGSFEFLKYLRHSNDYSDTSDTTGSSSSASGSQSSNGAIINHQLQPQQQSPSSSLIDLDSSTKHKPRSSRKVAALLSSVSRASNSLDSTSLDVFDHDSKHTIFDLHHITNSSNSNESTIEMSTLAFPNSHLNASNSNTSSEGAAASGADFAMLHSSSSAPKPLANFVIKDNFDVHPSHKVEEGIFQHMNKLPPKKKENLKQLGVRFTGQMTLADKSIVVDNFIKFCQEYDIKDHRPFLSLNQSGLNKPDQIKFARYLGQGLPTFTLFCIYSNFKNLFCTKRTEIYTKDGYNLLYILDKTKRFLSNTTADLKNMVHQQSNDGVDFTPNSATAMTVVPLPSVGGELTSKCAMPKVLEHLIIHENFDVHETHRVEDGVCTHITRLPPKKQEILKQFGIQSNQAVTYYEKYIIIENFIKFCNEYKISDHRPFLDFHESGLPKFEQVKFVRYLGQGLPNLTLNKIYLAFKDLLGMSRIEKISIDGYNLDLILKKKKKNLYNRMHAAGTSDNCFSSSNLVNLY